MGCGGGLLWRLPLENFVWSTEESNQGEGGCRAGSGLVKVCREEAEVEPEGGKERGDGLGRGWKGQEGTGRAWGGSEEGRVLGGGFREGRGGLGRGWEGRGEEGRGIRGRGGGKGREGRESLGRVDEGRRGGCCSGGSKRRQRIPMVGPKLDSSTAARPSRSLKPLRRSSEALLA